MALKNVAGAGSGGTIKDKTPKGKGKSNLDNTTDKESLGLYLGSSGEYKTAADDSDTRGQGLIDSLYAGSKSSTSSTDPDDILSTLGRPDTNAISTINSIISNSITGIEGVPYQFPATVDRRLTMNSDPADNFGIGRKYGEKIFSRFPLLFITPCTAEFMKGFSNSDKQTVVSQLITNGIEGFEELMEGQGKYYSVEFAYAEYYRYLNCMLNVLAIYLGIGDAKVKINGKKRKLATMDWSLENNSDFKTYFSAQENLVFYVDGYNSVSRSFSNDTGDSSLASTINGFADQVNEIKFLFGTGDGMANAVKDIGTEATSTITSALSKFSGVLGGSVVESLSQNGVNSILNGGKIIFPQIWNNSSMDDGSTSFDFKFRSPDNDTLSIYLNVLKPYCKLLCLCMPHQSQDSDGKYSPYSYSAPFLIRSSLKGKFNVSDGIIAGMSVTSGAECQWNDDGLPTQIDISIDIKNLYHNMSIATYDQPTKSIINNSQYMDFMANMAGLNIHQMDMGRKFVYYYYINKAKFVQIPSHIMSKGSQAISKLAGSLYNFTSGGS